MSQNPQAAEQFDEVKARTQLEWAQGLLEQAKARRFYGKLTFTFQGGLIENVVNEQKLKPPTMRRDE